MLAILLFRQFLLLLLDICLTSICPGLILGEDTNSFGLVSQRAQIKHAELPAPLIHCELREKLYLSILFDDDIKCCLCYTFIHRVCTLNNSHTCFCVVHIYLILRFWKIGIHEFLVYVILSATDQFLYLNHWTHTGTQSDIDRMEERNVSVTWWQMALLPSGGPEYHSAQQHDISLRPVSNQEQNFALVAGTHHTDISFTLIAASS